MTAPPLSVLTVYPPALAHFAIPLPNGIDAGLRTIAGQTGRPTDYLGTVATYENWFYRRDYIYDRQESQQETES